MNIIRPIKISDYNEIANFEVEISRISFREKAITDPEFHRKKIERAKDKSGMMVISSENDGVLGWMWMEKKQNSLCQY